MQEIQEPYKSIAPMWHLATTAQELMHVIKFVKHLDADYYEYLTDIQDDWSVPKKLSSERVRLELYFLYQSELGMSAGQASFWLNYNYEYLSKQFKETKSTEFLDAIDKDFKEQIDRMPY